jgi:putative ABC transport system substrate-binding protein
MNWVRPVWLLAILAIALSAWPALAEAQPKVARIGFLSASNLAGLQSRVEAFRQGLKELGYVEGRNVAVEYRWAEGKTERLRTLAVELERMPVDVIVTAGPSATRAAQQYTTRPIVMAFDSDPVASGFVANLARPGGSITGLSILAPEISGKQLDILRQIIPKLVRVGVFGNSNEPANAKTLEETQRAAHALGAQVHYQDLRTPPDLESAFQAARMANVQALIIFTMPTTSAVRAEVIALAIKYRLPVMSWQPQWVHSGGLLSYSANLDELHRRAATYVDKILKGAKPGDLPVELPYTFELLINLKTAKQIGLTVPVEVLARADKVID